jgi:Fic family protein
MNEGRSGRYVRQPNNYAAFIPAPLPPDPPLIVDDELQTLLSKADRALGRLDGSIQTLPDPDLFVVMYVRKEAVLSSQIEGTQSSLNDLLELEASIADATRPTDVSEVVNYVHAMNYGLSRLKELPLSVRLIREIHQQLLRDVRGRHLDPGEIRRTQNWIGAQGCSLNEATFVPPPPDQVGDHLSDLERFIHSDTNIPYLIKIGLIHAQFETIHPFLDGNGRVGRLLITFLLCQSEILIRPVLYLSYYFKRHRQEYYDLLQGVRDEGEWESWIKFFLEGVATVSLEATTTARAIVELRESHRQYIIEEFGRAAGNGLKVLESLYKTPFTTTKMIQDLLGITFPPANNLIKKMVAGDLLTEVTGQDRYRVYQYRPYVSLFSDPRQTGGVGQPDQIMHQ